MTKYEFKETNIVNGSVKINGSELLHFFYPNYQIIESNVLILNSPAIYKGPVEFLNRIRSFGHDIISVTALGQYDLKDKGTLINMTFTKWKKQPSKLLIKYLDKLDYDEVLEAVKIHWVCGKWTIKKYNRSGAFIKLLEGFQKGTSELFKIYFYLLRDKYNTGAYMEKSILSFLVKITNTNQVTSDWYGKIIRKYRKSKKHLLKQALDKYIEVPIDNKELKIYTLLQDLNIIDTKWK